MDHADDSPCLLCYVSESVTGSGGQASPRAYQAPIDVPASLAAALSDLLNPRYTHAWTQRAQSLGSVAHVEKATAASQKATWAALQEEKDATPAQSDHT